MSTTKTAMRPVLITMEESLVAEVDAEVSRLNARGEGRWSRSLLVRQGLELLLSAARSESK